MKYYFDVTLLAQDYNIGCWAACTRMIWETAGKGNPISANLFQTAKSLYDTMNAPRILVAPWENANTHDPDCSAILDVLHQVGLREVPRQESTFYTKWLEQMLPQYGPMFVGGFWGQGGSFHALVINGVDGSLPDPIMIKDPWPVGKGGQITSMAFAKFNDLKAPRLPILYLPNSWRKLCHGVPASQGGPDR